MAAVWTSRNNQIVEDRKRALEELERWQEEWDDEDVVMLSDPPTQTNTILVTEAEMLAETQEIESIAPEWAEPCIDEIESASSEPKGRSMLAFIMRIAKNPLFSWVCMGLIWAGTTGLELAKKPTPPPSPAAVALINSMKGDPQWATDGEALKLGNVASVQPTNWYSTAIGHPVRISHEDVFTDADKKHIRDAYDEMYPAIKARETDARAKSLKESLSAKPQTTESVAKK